MSHIFISYSKKDRDYVRQLVNGLLDNGFDVWIDDRKLHSSEDWWNSIVAALWSSAALVVVLSPNSDESRWVQREIMIADSRSKVMFPLLLKGDIDTPNWQLFVRTQYTDVRDGSLPSADFYDTLAQYTPRQTKRGTVVTTNPTDGTITLDLDDEDFQAAIREAPPREEELALSIRQQPWFLPALLIAALLIVGVAVVGARALNPPTTPVPTSALSAIPTVVTAIAAETVEPTVEPTLTEDLLAAVANVESLNTWREANGYPDFVPEQTLDALADEHASELSARPLSELGNISRNDDLKDIHQMAAEAGYVGTVQMVVDVIDGDMTVGDVLLRLDAIGEENFQERYHEIGFSSIRMNSTGKLYFVLILGTG